MSHIPGHKDAGARRNVTPSGKPLSEREQAFRTGRGGGPPKAPVAGDPETQDVAPVTPSGVPLSAQEREFRTGRGGGPVIPTPAIPTPAIPAAEEPKEVFVPGDPEAQALPGPLTPEQVGAQERAAAAAVVEEVPDAFDEMREGITDPAMRGLFDLVASGFKRGDAAGGMDDVGLSINNEMTSLLSEQYSKENMPKDPQEDMPTSAGRLTDEFSPQGHWRWSENQMWVPTAKSGDDQDDYIRGLELWRSGLLGAASLMQGQHNQALSSLMGIVTLAMQAEALKVAVEDRQQFEVGQQVAQAATITERDTALAKQATDLANQIHTNAVELMETRQGLMDKRADLDRAIDQGALDELVRNQKSINALNEKKFALEETKARWGMLSDMLANGSMGFFSMALVDPTGARQFFNMLTGGAGVPGGAGGTSPFAQAGELRGQLGTFGEFSVPSMQGLAGMSDVERQRLNAAFAGTGRSLESEVGRLTPLAATDVQRSR